MHMLMGFKIKNIMIGETCKKSKQQANRYKYNASRYLVWETVSLELKSIEIYSQNEQPACLYYPNNGYRVFGVCET